MRLLMITRKVDLDDASPAAPAFHLVEKIGKQLEKLYVITWQESDRGNLPENIEIVSLPKNKFLKVVFLQWHLLKILPKADGLFCHQNPEYTILGAPLARLLGKRVITWYTHGTVNWKLHLVDLLANKILTASEKSCRLKNRKKIEVTGHGIDLEYFKPSDHRCESGFTILSIGRISPAKDYQTLIKAIEILVNQSKANNLEVQIIGGPVLKKDKKYFNKLKQLVKDRDLEEYIKFLGPISHSQLLPYFQNCDLFTNQSQTGSIDKAVLIAMACGRLVLTSNEAFGNVLNNKRLIFKNKDPDDLAKKIISLVELSKQEKEEIRRKLRQEVKQNHNINNLVKKIINQF